MAGLWWLFEGANYLSLVSDSALASIRPFISVTTFLLAMGTVVYTAFLLGQAEGRDMWQSSLLPFQLLSQSLMVGIGVFLVVAEFDNYLSDIDLRILLFLFLLVTGVNLVITLTGMFAMPFASEVALLASREMTHGKFRNHFWWGAIVLGHITPLVLYFLFGEFNPVIVVCSIVGLFFYEYAFVMAPQYIPNS